MADQVTERSTPHQLESMAPKPQTAALVVIAVLAVLYTLYLAQALVLPFMLAIVLNLLLQPAKRFLRERLRLPAPLVALLLIVVLFGIVGAIGFAISVPASGWIAKAPDALSALQQKLGFLQQPIQYVRHGWDQLQHAMQSVGQQTGEAPATPAPTPPTAASGGLPAGLGGFGISLLAGTQAFMGQLFTLLVLLFFLLSSGDTVFRRVIEVLPSFGDKRRVVEMGEQIQRNVSGYLATISVMNLLVGVLNGLSTWACGLPDPLLWGTVAFLLNYIPIIGPVTGVGIFFFVGLFTFSSVVNAFIPAGIYLLIHVMEGETITPMLLASRFTLNPVMVIASLFFWDWMWGVIGALLSVPLLAIAKIICDGIEPLRPLGHVLGGPPPKKGAG
jgi:predicted PurR-regulated permease PerM